MNPILDRLATEWRSDFRPTSPTEFLALRLAARLGEPQAARHFALLASEHGVEKLIAAFQRTVTAVRAGKERARHFHTELLRNGRNGAYTTCTKTNLAGIRVERRSIGAAIFRDTRLENVRVRQLPAKPAKAEQSCAMFINELIREHDFESAAVETAPSGSEVQRLTWTRIVLNQLRENSISVWELNRAAVASAFAHPPLRTRTQLRQIIQAIWPQLSLKQDQVSVLDAAAMGLFIQTERLFNNF